jgi:hypothetical protein
MELDAAPPTTLRALLVGLRPGTVTLHAGDTDVAVAEPVICDPTDLSVVRPGDLVLAVGSHGWSRDTLALLRRAETAGACGVVVATDEPPPQEATEVADTAGVALLTTPSDVSWGRLYALLRTMATSASDPGPGVPVGDLFRLADAIAAMVGGPVTIEDPRSVVLAYSTGDEDIDEPRRQAILGRRVGDDWLQAYRDSGFFKRLWASDKPLSLPGTDELRPRLVMAVRAAGEVLGSIWVAEAGRPFDEAARTALASAARLTALHLLRYRETADLDRRRRADAVIELLDHGRGDAAELGLEPDSQLSVLAVEPQGVEGADAVAVLQRLGDMVALTCEAAVPGASAVVLGTRVYAVIPDAGGLRAHAIVPQLLERIRASLHRPVLVGVGGRVAGLSDVPVSRSEADLVLRALEDDPQDRRWAHIEEVRARTVLLRLRDLARNDPHLSEGSLTTLVEHDGQKDSSYVETLRAYLHAFGDVTVAAASLNVHPNTFRYRLRRLVEVSGIDLDDPEQRLVAELQLRFLD